MDNSSKGGGCILFIIVLALLGSMMSCLGCFPDDEPKTKSKTCESCGKTFTNSDDVNSIIWTNMCEPCYEDYKYLEELREELLKYEERN